MAGRIFQAGRRPISPRSRERPPGMQGPSLRMNLQIGLGGIPPARQCSTPLVRYSPREADPGAPRHRPSTAASTISLHAGAGRRGWMGEPGSARDCEYVNPVCRPPRAAPNPAHGRGIEGGADKPCPHAPCGPCRARGEGSGRFAPRRGGARDASTAPETGSQARFRRMTISQKREPLHIVSWISIPYSGLSASIAART